MTNKDVGSSLRWTSASSFYSPQATKNSQIWGQLGRYSSIRVHPHALETAYQWLKHFVYVYHGCMKWSVVSISLKHDVVASFPLHKWTWIPKSGVNLTSVTVWGCTHMTLRQHDINGLNTLYMSNIDVWSSLRWISASTMTLCHHVHSSSDPESSNLVPTWPVKPYKGASICPWDSIPMAQTLCICLIWMYTVVWGEYQTQTWCCGIISTPQVTLNPQIWGQLGRCNGIREHPYDLETAWYQWLKHFVYV